MTDVCRLSAVELGRAMKTGSLSPVAVLEAHLLRIEAVNPKINAISGRRFEQAKREAAAAETTLLRGEQVGPLFGVPCTIKEFLPVSGMPYTGGLHSRRRCLASQDGPVVARLKEAGVIVMATSTVPEGGLWLETLNPIQGRTSNPRDLKRTSGGSSGGEGALIAAGASPFGIGSDVGGSIRIPAAFCGIAGHKPSGRLVPNTGHFPAIDPAGSPFLVKGPMARSVDDLEAVMSIISGPDGLDEACISHDWRHQGDLKGLRVISVPQNGRTQASDEMVNAVEAAAAALVKAGAQRVEVELPELKAAFDIWTAMMTDITEHGYDHVLGDGESMSVRRELCRLLLGDKRRTWPAVLIAGIEKIAESIDKRRPRLVKKGRQLKSKLDAILGNDGVLLHPPYARTAPRHRAAMFAPFAPAYTAIFNVMESPVSTLPIHYSAKGLPIGVQIVGAWGKDGLCLKVAKAMELEFGGFRPALL